MKKLFLILILLSGLTASAQRVSELTETTSTPDGLLISVSTPSGTNWLTRKITYANFTFRITTNFQAELVTVSNHVTTNILGTLITVSNSLQTQITTVSNLVTDGNFIPTLNGEATNLNVVNLGVTGTEGNASILTTDRQLHDTNGWATVFWGSGKMYAAEALGFGETLDWFNKELKHDWTFHGMRFADVQEETGNVTMSEHQSVVSVDVGSSVRTVTLPISKSGKQVFVHRGGNSGNQQHLKVIPVSGEKMNGEIDGEIRIYEQRGSRIFVGNEAGDGWLVFSLPGAGTVFDAPQMADAMFDTAFSISNELATASAVTNYPISFTNAWPVINTANTNANLTFENLSAGKSLTVIFDAVTSSIPCVVSIPADLLTNANLNLTVTNGTAKAINFYAIDGSTTNILVSDGGVYSR